MKRKIWFAVLTSGILSLIAISCKHDPYIPIDPNPPSGGLCDLDTVYFQNQVLPLLVSNCTESGCHNPQDHKEGVVVSTYEQLLSTVERVTQTDWNKNKLVKSLVEGEMPQGKPAFTAAQIDLIKKWVSQGALNNSCDESYGGCDTTIAATYSAFVKPLIDGKCKGCHSGSNPQGGIKLSTYAEIKAQAVNGKLYNSVTVSSNWMPKGGAKLSDCNITKLKTWIDAGALEN